MNLCLIEVKHLAFKGLKKSGQMYISHTHPNQPTSGRLQCSPLGLILNTAQKLYMVQWYGQQWACCTLHPYVFHELVNFQVQFNVLVIVYKVLHGTGPSYLRKQLSMIVSIYQIYWEEWMLSKST